MSFEQIIFYIFSAILVAAAVGVITVRNPVHAALFLVMCFITTSALWLLLEAEFLAITLVLVYVGAVMVLFLFVVMMLDINIAKMREGFTGYLPLGALVAGGTIAVMWYVANNDYFNLTNMPPPERLAADASNTRMLGEQLYTTYVYPFEIAAVILLLAIVAAITLTLRHRTGTRYQKIDQQVRVKRDERVRMVKMESEERK
ncbi:MAG: NADH-quinone oxidoreductase subunit J [Gammaproteobacteria bacterium]|nr:NADH-quinone oxidoreductase subunit J [Gammaproteobacteria bacterium]MCW8839548.1 NADH-quinone oxidoreductase subunit J [Gammaproteobacteria bacterium]MCW8959684.1 NADH-quinone oxidoreductase subunit J [Gammaproteobacteria bacterium]MCW8973513.1 NADH-quinone oxidoreductase subunit J [Gammaproteobacteria bacterium]MCW8992677.1 NADH-quinone oxidoreductase subunit J [Gammaproteobacteria bacterium]